MKERPFVRCTTTFSAPAPSRRAGVAASPPSPPVVCLPAASAGGGRLRLTVRVLPAFPLSGSPPWRASAAPFGVPLFGKLVFSE